MKRHPRGILVVGGLIVPLVLSVMALLLGSCAVAEKAWERVGEAGYVHFVLVNKNNEADRAVYVDAIRSLCRPEMFCSLRFWSDKAKVPTSLPMTVAQSHAITATYLYNRFLLGGEQFRWNCRIKNDPPHCFNYG